MSLADSDLDKIAPNLLSLIPPLSLMAKSRFRSSSELTSIGKAEHCAIKSSMLVRAQDIFISGKEEHRMCIHVRSLIKYLLDENINNYI